MVAIEQLHSFFNQYPHTATYNVKKALVKHMIQTFGINTTDVYGDTMLTHAVLMNNAEIATILIEHGALVNKSNVCGSTPLLLAAEQENAELVKILIFAGADYTTAQFNKFSPRIQVAILDMLTAEDTMTESH